MLAHEQLQQRVEALELELSQTTQRNVHFAAQLSAHEQRLHDALASIMRRKPCRLILHAWIWPSPVAADAIAPAVTRTSSPSPMAASG